MGRNGEVSTTPDVRPNRPLACAIRCIGFTATGAAILLFAPTAAHADDDRGLLGKLLGGVTETVGQIVDPVITPVLEPVGELVSNTPVVGPILGPVVGSNPVTTITQPVTGAFDGLLGGTLGSLPVVGGLVGTTPVGSITSPLTGTVDGVLTQLAPDGSVVPGQPGEPGAPGAPGGPNPDDPGTVITLPDGTVIGVDDYREQMSARLAELTGPLTQGEIAAAADIEHRDTLSSATVPVAPGITPFSDPQDVPVTATPGAWAAGVSIPLAAYGDLVSTALIVVLVMGITILARSRAPPRLVGDIDSSPD